MKIVICGSLSCTGELQHVEKELKELFPSANIITPCNETRQKQSLFQIHQEYDLHIKSADLVVVVPKYVELGTAGDTRMLFNFGESTTYEMAIAQNELKNIVIWPNFLES